MLRQTLILTFFLSCGLKLCDGNVIPNDPGDGCTVPFSEVYSFTDNAGKKLHPNEQISDGANVTVDCLYEPVYDDYSEDDSATIRCVDGTLTPILFECPEKIEEKEDTCRNLQVKHGEVKRNLLGEYTIACHHGYSLNIPKALRKVPCECNNQKFQCAGGIRPRCKPDSCIVPLEFEHEMTIFKKNPNGKMVYLTAKHEAHHKDFVFFNCSRVDQYFYEPVLRRFRCLFGNWTDADRPTYSHGNNGEFPQCRKAICQPPCANGGSCIRDDECRCSSHLITGDRCQTFICNDNCTINGGECTAPGICGKCPLSRIGENCEIKVICNDNCTINGGKCIAPGICGNCPLSRSGENCEIQGKQCEDIGAFRGGDYVYNGDRGNGTEVHYFCDDGYSQGGNDVEMSVCEVHGDVAMWNPATPTCYADAFVEVPENGNTTYEDYMIAHDQSYEIYCPEGLEFNFNDVVNITRMTITNDKGTLIPEVPGCIPARCNPSHLENTDILYLNGKPLVGLIANGYPFLYTCKPGFEFINEGYTKIIRGVCDFGKFQSVQECIPSCFIPDHEDLTYMKNNGDVVSTEDQIRNGEVLHVKCTDNNESEYYDYNNYADQNDDSVTSTPKPQVLPIHNVTCERGILTDPDIRCSQGSCIIPLEYKHEMTIFKRSPAGKIVQLMAKHEVHHKDFVFFNCSRVDQYFYEPSFRKFQCLLGNWRDADRPYSHGNNGEFPQCRQAICDPPCENGGSCIRDGECRCNSQLITGNRCQIFNCNDNCVINGGKCTAPGICGKCPLSRSGENCEIQGKQCEDIRTFHGGEYEYNGDRGNGTEARYRCYDGYSQGGNDVEMSVCEVYGDVAMWNPAPPTCYADAFVKVPDNGHKRYEDYMIAHGQSYEIYCPERLEFNFTDVVNITRMNITNNNGTLIPEVLGCVPARCNPSQLENTDILYSNGKTSVGLIRHDDSIQYTCKSGYEFINESDTKVIQGKCDFGKFQNVQECIPSCFIPDDKDFIYMKNNGIVVSTMDQIRNGEVLYVKCSDIDELVLGDYYDYDDQVNDLVTLTQKPQVLPKHTVTCERGILSEPDIQCSQARCDSSQLENTDIFNSNGKQLVGQIGHGNPIRYTCKHGYEFINEGETKALQGECEFGKFRGVQECISSCFIPDDKDFTYMKNNGSVVSIMDQIRNGEVLYVKCSDIEGLVYDDYDNYADQIDDSVTSTPKPQVLPIHNVTCERGILTEPEIQCSQDVCKELNNGEVTKISYDNYEVKCDLGYTINLPENMDRKCSCGNGQLTCSGHIPLCSPGNCVIPDDYDSSKMTISKDNIQMSRGTQVNHGDKVIIDCTENFGNIMEPDDTGYECRAGQWIPDGKQWLSDYNGTFPECKIIKKGCQVPDLSGKSKVNSKDGSEVQQYSYVRDGEAIILDCDNGIINNLYTCIDGNWTINAHENIEKLKDRDSINCEVSSSQLQGNIIKHFEVVLYDSMEKFFAKLFPLWNSKRNTMERME